MQFRGLMRLALVTFLAGLLAAPTAAQADPLDPTARAQLAAIPLTTGDLPDGYRLAGEGFLQGQGESLGGVETSTLNQTGFLGMYASTYDLQGGGGTITSYASMWKDHDAAVAGFGLLEDEAKTDPEAKLTDQALDAGDGPAELTTGTRQGDAGTLNVSDGTFVVDRFVVGVSVEATADNALGDDAMSALISAQESRASAVVAGDAPAGVDLSLPGKVLDTRPLGDELRAGFVTAPESEALYGVKGSSLGGVQTSWVSLVGTGDGAGAPYVVVAVSSFENPENAGRVLDQADGLVPVTIELQPIDGFQIDGADSARGFQYASPGSADGSLDSFRGVAQLGSQIVVVDVQQASSANVAQQAVTDLVSAEVTCLGGTCQLPEVSLGG